MNKIKCGNCGDIVLLTKPQEEEQYLDENECRVCKEKLKKEVDKELASEKEFNMFRL